MAKVTSGGDTKSFIRRAYQLIYKSEFLHYLMQNAHEQLKNFWGSYTWK